MNFYDRNTVYESTLKYFKGDQLSANVWINKYALKDSNGNIYELTPDDMHKRLSKELHRIESKYINPISEEEIYDLIKDFKYIVPQGGSMSGIGNNLQTVSLSNCFVVGNEADSYGGIFMADQEQAQLMKRRGGVGHDMSHIRPKGFPVKNSALSSTGIVPFMERYSNTTREVAQDGRRGALMLSCSIKHPDIEEFIDAKMEQGKVTGANVSVKITDDFMKAALEDSVFFQQYPIVSDNPVIAKEVNAKNIWDKIVHNAWKSAEPGIMFWDTMINESIPDCYSDLGYKTVSTNPCGEIPLCPYDSCRLLAINLYSYVKDPFTKNAKFNYELFGEHVIIAQRFMDDIIDLEIEKIDSILKKIKSDPENQLIKQVEIDLWKKIQHKAKEGRRTGLGVTAEGDMLAALNIKYGTKKGTEFSAKIHKLLAIEAYTSSCIMAEERGAFEIYDFDREKNNPLIKRLFEAKPELEELHKKHGRRNIALLTIAPTGTVSLMTQTTSGIEPVFQLYYKRNRKVNPNDKDSRVDFVDEIGDAWESYNVFHPKFFKWLKINDYNIEKVKLMSNNDIAVVIEKTPWAGATSADVDWLEKVKMQGEIQKWVDHSISVTVNLPKEVTEEMVSKVYEEAWKSGCKGITVYREGSRSGVLVSTNDDEKKTLEQIIKENNAPRRPKNMECDILRFQNKGEKWIGFVGLLEGQPYEIFTGIIDSFNIPTYVEKGVVRKMRDENGKSRYDFVYEDKDGYEVIMTGLSRAFNREYWNTGKFISAILRHGMPLPNVIALMDSISLDGDYIGTWKSGVKRMLKKYIKDNTTISAVCPECGQDTLVFNSGCVQCTNPECVYSKCE